jgi:hypothetical protein
VRRVTICLGLVPEGASDLLMIYAVREAYPEFPGIFDLALWRTGKEVSIEAAPGCGDCKLSEYCAFAAGRR